MREFNDIQIPESVLDRVHEYTNGGFILATITSKGNVLVSSSCDSESVKFSLLEGLDRYIKEDRQPANIVVISEDDDEDDFEEEEA